MRVRCDEIETLALFRVGDRCDRLHWSVSRVEESTRNCNVTYRSHGLSDAPSGQDCQLTGFAATEMASPWRYTDFCLPKCRRRVGVIFIGRCSLRAVLRPESLDLDKTSVALARCAADIGKRQRS